MENYVTGNDVIVKIDNGNGYAPFVCATDFTLEVSTDDVEITTVTSGWWRDFEGDRNSWVINLSGAFVLESVNNYPGLKFLQSQEQFIKIKILVEFKDTNSKLYTLSGTALITKSNIAANAGQSATSDFTLKGCGKYELVEGAVLCSANIAAFAVENSVNGAYTIALTCTLDTLYVVYRINNVEGTVLCDISGLAVFSGTLSPGNYALIATPYCANDLFGVEKIFNFTIT